MYIIKEANYPIDLKKMKANPIPKDLKKKWMKKGGVDNPEYKEWILKHWTQESILDKVPSTKIAENVSLNDGRYQGYFYSWVLEINRVKYPTLYGIKCTKEFCGGLKEFVVRNNKAY